MVDEKDKNNIHVRRFEPELDQLVETLIFLYTEGRRLSYELSSKYGLTAQQLAVLKILQELNGLKVSDLSERIKLKDSTVTGIIDRMERDGLVQRERSEDDRRVVKLNLTEKGSELARSIPISPMESLRSAIETLSKEEKKQLLRLLTKIGVNIRTAFSSF